MCCPLAQTHSQISSGCHTTLSSFLHLLTYKDFFLFSFLCHTLDAAICPSRPPSTLTPLPIWTSEPPLWSSRWGGRWRTNVSQFWPGTHFLLFDRITRARTHTHTVQYSKKLDWLQFQVVLLLRQKLVESHVGVDGVNLYSLRSLTKTRIENMKR